MDRCNASIIPLQWELHSACSRCSSRYCTAGLFNTAGGTRNKLARCRSRNCPTPLSHAYLVKPLRLLPGPCKGLGIRSISSDPHKHRICTNTSKWRPTNSSHPDSVMVSALKLASEKMQFYIFKTTISSEPQGERVQDYTPLSPLRNLSVVHDSGDVDVCDQLCPHKSTGNANSNTCTTRAVRTFRRRECLAYFVVSRLPPGSNYQCREAKYVIPRLHKTRTTQSA